MRKKKRKNRLDMNTVQCIECHKATCSTTRLCFACFEKKNELAQYLILKKADKEDNLLMEKDI
jgi:hypothetical protein